MSDEHLKMWKARDPASVLRATIVGEAAGDGTGSQYGVACVVRNRATIGGWWGSTISSVCLKKSQFSCWWADFSLRKTDMERSFLFPSRFRSAHKIAEIFTTSDPIDVTDGATHYLNPSVLPELPSWVKGMKETARLGSHRFYR